MNNKPLDDADVRRSERIAHFEAELVETAAGLFAGACIGAIAGPVGIAAGAAIGGAVGALASMEMEREDRRVAARDRALDSDQIEADEEVDLEDEEDLEDRRDIDLTPVYFSNARVAESQPSFANPNLQSHAARPEPEIFCFVSCAEEPKI